ncbi:MAG: mannose-1-phosphate guanylyltransferase/mannose-6-phosphate isomerase [Salinisphaeraceae bacterium]|nr:mannose-1-phosphate guanylyltransferase/mannose-6-phosphate isomerase [Salinisphaeraceae bacterium]
MITPVLLAGGSGTRLWPLSRKLYPKQFLPLVGAETLLEATTTRLQGLEVNQVIAVCGEDHRFVVAEQLRNTGHESARILLEPLGRDTAPAIAVAALEALEGADDDPVLLVLPSDHCIENIDSFHAAVRLGLEQAQQGHLVTFGIVPTGPATGYGYIQVDTNSDEQAILPLLNFVEKPELETAKEYLATGGYYWNSGMFMFRAKDYLERLATHQAEMHAACAKAHSEAEREFDFIRLGHKAFESCPADSIDYAVMEKTDQAVVIPLDAGWSDLGSWDAVAEVAGPDENGNVLQGDVVELDNRNCLLRSEGRLLAAVGLDNQVVIETSDAVLVADKGQLQNVKTLVQQLQKLGRDEAVNPAVVHRPWGSYETVAEGGRFQVKRIIVKPGARLSLQMHHHRAEHWVVVQGTAEVFCDDKTLLLSENESTYIPLGARHRLGNPGNIALELIEIQSGSYLGEDDIVRFEDHYGRANQ